MTHKNKVVLSINFDGEMMCVDVLQRPNGTFGFDEFRRDPEYPQGWFCLVHYGRQAYSIESAAIKPAPATLG